MTDGAGYPTPLLRCVGARPAAGDYAPPPCQLALSLREYAASKGLSVMRLARSRVRHSGSFHLEMTDRHGRTWHMRISDHMRPRRTGHATPHVDLVSFDGLSGIHAGRKLIDAIVDGSAPWFDADATVRPMPKTRRGSRKRRNRDRRSVERSA